MVLVFPIKRRIWDEIDLEMYAWGRIERRGIINNELLMIASKKREGMLQQLHKLNSSLHLNHNDCSYTLEDWKQQLDTYSILLYQIKAKTCFFFFMTVPTFDMKDMGERTHKTLSWE